MAVKNTMKQRNYGLPNPLAQQFPNPISAVTDPTVFDVGGTVGQVWVNTDTPTVNFYVGSSGGQATWVNVHGGAGVFSSLTVTPGPIHLTGTTTINTTGAASTTIGTGGTGTVSIGNATGNTSVTGTLTVSSTFTTTNGNHIAGNTAASATGPNLEMRKSRTGGVITVGDVLGNVLFEGNDGTTNIVGAAIVSTSTGTIATNRVASTLSFWTHPDSTGALASRMTINSAGNVTIATPDSGVGLTIAGSGQTISAGDLNMVNGSINISNAGTYLSLPGDVRILTGNGAPAGGLATAIGNLYINLSAATAASRIYIADTVGTWTNIVCAA